MSRILIVDDDAGMRSVICRALERSGHEAVEAVDGRAGLEITKSGHLDLVVTDIVMPEMEGIELILHLRRIIPQLKVIAISGGGRLASEECYLRLARSSGATKILAKPFELDALLGMVEELLAAAEPKPAADRQS